MKIIKPYGRTILRLNKPSQDKDQSDKPHHRKLLLRNSKKIGIDKIVDIDAFAHQDPDIMIAQWISVIDKIFKKPKNNKKASQFCHELRQKLGEACWSIVQQKIKEQNINIKEQELIRLKNIWWAKIHPYKIDEKNNDNQDKKCEEYKGRWYQDFCGATEPSINMDFNKIAQKIEIDLYHNALRKRRKCLGDHPNPSYRFGRIKHRAQSIHKNTLYKEYDNQCDALHICDHIKNLYKGEGDVAQKIYRCATQIENRKISYSQDVAQLLYEHYAKIFKDELGHPLPRAQAKKIKNGGLLKSHDAICRYYKDFFKSKARNDTLIERLPKDLGALVKHIDASQQNKERNALIRRGKVIYYHMQNDRQNEVWQLPSEDQLKTSRYWQEDGQALIKRSEAYVRIWCQA
ncbi:MAG: hypothetical protein AAF403_01650, partial [Pseudomonadota bacterium]